jgi:hypothetical protein
VRAKKPSNRQSAIVLELPFPGTVLGFVAIERKRTNSSTIPGLRLLIDHVALENKLTIYKCVK